MFLPTFVMDTKIVYCYNFVTPLTLMIIILMKMMILIIFLLDLLLGLIDLNNVKHVKKGQTKN